VFTCERCGSGYSSMHAVGIENCPRCLLKDRTASPLRLKVFTLAELEAVAEIEPDDQELRTKSQDDVVTGSS
jgi:hypothetical protein